MTAASPASFPFLSVLIFSPLAAVAVLLLLRSERAQRWWTFAFTTVAALFSLLLLREFNADTHAFQFTEQAAWIPALKIDYAIGVDGISLLLVLLTTLITPLCVLASWNYIQKRVKEFMIGLLLMETTMLGVFCALDTILFFVFWEAMLIPMALLIGIWGGPRRVYAALKFFIYTMAGSVFLLVALIALRLKTGSFDLIATMGQPFSSGFQAWVFAAFLVSFAIKVPMFPFHTWLPAAHVEAPTAGSVLLASVLLKMGTYGFLRFALPITPDAVHAFGPVIMWVSVAAILYGGFAALAQTDLKKLVAYSSVSHMGFATLGIFALNAGGLEGATLVTINHGITTGGLFMVVGLIYERLHTRDLAAAAGIGKHMPVFAFCYGVFCLSSLAFPGTNSFVGEFLVLAGGFKVSKLLVACAVPGIVAAAAYNLRMLQKLAYGGTKNPPHNGLADLNFREVVMFVPLVVFVFWIGLNPRPVLRIMHASVTHLAQQANLPAERVADTRNATEHGQDARAASDTTGGNTIATALP
jgi:NADH-quinone oxidoreductase subunit M